MSAHTLPGTIPGLIRRCSPVIWVAADGEREGVVVRRVKPHWHIYGVGIVSARIVGLDLTDPTGRVHAGIWLRDCIEHDECTGDPDLSRLSTVDRRLARALAQAAMGGRGDPALIQRVVLACAEVTP